MAANSYEKLIEEIGNMTALELADFVKALEEKFDVSAAMPTAAAPAATQEQEAPAAEEEKSEFNVTLQEAGDKIKSIKALKTASGLSLADAKAAVENAPSVIAEAAPKEKAQEIKQKLEEVGCKVELS